jgi:hypothetical protein
MLSGIETTKDKVLRIILAGQPELNAKLDSPELVQLAQRVRLRFHLGALSSDDTEAYIRHRLEVAGSDGREIFEPGTFALIYRYSGGVPRLINTLCETAMMAAFTTDRDNVLVTDVQAAIEELRWTEYAERPGQKPASAAVGDDHTATGNFSEQGTPRQGPELYIGASDTSRQQTQELPVAKLIVVTDGRTVGELPLRMGRTVIGRTPDNDLQIDSRFVSRHHCQIVTQANACVVEDLNSTNGIVVKSQRVRRHNLNDGDVITIGRHDLIYIDERSSARSGMTGSHPAPPAAAEPSGPDHDETQVN